MWPITKIEYTQEGFGNRKWKPEVQFKPMSFENWNFTQTDKSGIWPETFNVWIWQVHFKYKGEGNWYNSYCFRRGSLIWIKFTSKIVFKNDSFWVRTTLLIQNKEAHNAGITCMSLMVDAERNVFVLTGSYDKVVKEYIWNSCH